MKTFARIVAFLPLVVVCCFALGFGWRNFQRRIFPAERSVRGLFGVRSSAEDSAQSSCFARRRERILTNYVRPVAPVDLKYAGIEGA